MQRGVFVNVTYWIEYWSTTVSWRCAKRRQLAPGQLLSQGILLIKVDGGLLILLRQLLVSPKLKMHINIVACVAILKTPLHQRLAAIHYLRIVLLACQWVTGNTMWAHNNRQPRKPIILTVRRLFFLLIQQLLPLRFHLLEYLTCFIARTDRLVCAIAHFEVGALVEQALPNSGSSSSSHIDRLIQLGCPVFCLICLKFQSRLQGHFWMVWTLVGVNDRAADRNFGSLFARIRHYQLVSHLILLLDLLHIKFLISGNESAILDKELLDLLVGLLEVLHEIFIVFQPAHAHQLFQVLHF